MAQFLENHNLRAKLQDGMKITDLLAQLAQRAFTLPFRDHFKFIFTQDGITLDKES